MELTKITTRLPKTLKLGLDEEAKELGITANELCLMKLSQPLMKADAGTVLAQENDLALLQMRKQIDLLVQQNSQLLELVQSLSNFPNASNLPELPQDIDASQMPALDSSLETTLELTRAEFVRKYPEMKDETGKYSNTYAKASIKARQSHWLAPDGMRWTVTGDGRDAQWHSSTV